MNPDQKIIDTEAPNGWESHPDWPAIGVIAEVLADQGVPYPKGRAELILKSLRDNGYAVVQLPEPVGGEWPVDSDRLRATSHVYLDQFGDIPYPRYLRTTEEVRDLAVALLAAVHAAENRRAAHAEAAGKAGQ